MRAGMGVVGTDAGAVSGGRVFGGAVGKDEVGRMKDERGIGIRNPSYKGFWF
jgi:hypothetical protein